MNIKTAETRKSEDTNSFEQTTGITVDERIICTTQTNEFTKAITIPLQTDNTVLIHTSVCVSSTIMAKGTKFTGSTTKTKLAAYAWFLLVGLCVMRDTTQNIKPHIKCTKPKITKNFPSLVARKPKPQVSLPQSARMKKTSAVAIKMPPVHKQYTRPYFRAIPRNKHKPPMTKTEIKPLSPLFSCTQPQPKEKRISTTPMHTRKTNQNIGF